MYRLLQLRGAKCCSTVKKRAIGLPIVVRRNCVKCVMTTRTQRPFVPLFFSANIVSAAPGMSSYAEVAKTKTMETKEPKEKPTPPAAKQAAIQTAKPDLKPTVSKKPEHPNPEEAASQAEDREHDRIHVRSRDHSDDHDDRDRHHRDRDCDRE